ncbi:PAS domain-containing sensor histidine kinase [Nevskia sp.]|uniref:PAS domain-containing sensor histidine kinase n=1 Tax=Nevskia sp. TaxID=1929292 RepID=UPI003F711754
MDGKPGDRRLTESGAGFAEWFDAVHESVVVRDLDGRVLVWNTAAEQLYGWPREQLIGQLAETWLRSEPAATREFGEQQLLATGRWDGELRRRNDAGQELQLELRWVLQRDDEGRPAHVVETGRDLSERRRAEAALIASEQRYRNLFGAMAASFWELDFSGVGTLLRELRKAGVDNYAQYFARHPEFCRQMIGATRIVDVNDETVRLFGRGDKAELMADLNAFWPDESLAVYAASTLAAVGGLSHYSIETRLRRLDGSVFDALFTACFAPEAVARGRLLIGVIDISERKHTFAALERSESRYRNLFQAMAVSFWQLDSSRLNTLFAGLRAQGVTDLHAYIDAHPEFLQRAMEASVAIDVNERALKLFGASDVQQLLGPVTRFWMPGRAEAFRGSIEAGWRREPGYQAETRLRTVDGREIDVLFFVTAPPEMRDKGMVLVGNIDISEQVAGRAVLRQLQAELAHAGRVSMLGELTASIAHEVNQPLAAIATNGAAGLRWLSRAEPDLGEAKALLQRMSDDARRAAAIIARIRGMALRRAPEPAPLALDALVQEAMQFLQHELRAQQVQLHLQLAPNLPAVQGDRVQLQQVIVNLVVNALQAMAQAGSPRRELRIETALTAAGEIELAVLDSGPGIAAENLRRLFESFFSTKPNGMGLGLPVCRSIVEAHGGRMVAGNRGDGCGARFAMTLPVATVD